MAAFRIGFVGGAWRQAGWGTWLLATLVLGPLGASAQTAPDVVVLCDTSLRHVLVAAGQSWQAKHQVPVRVLTASLQQNAALVMHGARADILVGIGAQRIDDAQRLGALDRGAPIVIGRDPVVIAVRGRNSQPRRLGPGDDLGSLMGFGRFGIVETAFGGAGLDARSALAGIGLWPGLEPRSLGSATADGLKQLLDDGSVHVAALYQTELAGDPALSVAATFLAPAPSVIAALAKEPLSPNARDFLAFLTTDGQRVLQQNGMEAP